MNKKNLLAMATLIFMGVLTGCAPRLQESSRLPHKGIDHLVVIYAENRSFDNLFGLFPGADGILQATDQQKIQLDHDGTPLKNLALFDHHGLPDPAYPRLANGPFQMEVPPVNRPPDQMAPNPTHAFYHHKEQINGGKNNMFAAMSKVGGWVMGYYDGSKLKLWQWAKEYTLADHFFTAAYGSSYLNHFWLVCGCTPQHKDAPAAMRIRLDENGRLAKMPGSPSASQGAVKVFSDNRVQVTPDGWSVNTSQPPYQPSGIPPAAEGPASHADSKGTGKGENQQVPLPPQTQLTIGDTLSAKGVSWAWYAGAYRQALADGMQDPSAVRQVIYNKTPPSPIFQAHHQPFNYFARYGHGTTARQEHLKDGEDFFAHSAAGTLPAVSFYKPAGRLSQHPGLGNVMAGDNHLDEVLQKLRASPQWPNMLIIVTYDENGGFWDHVPPPQGEGWSDAFGPGNRVPALLIGPMVKKGFIDSTPYDTTSILKWITERFDLDPLPGVRGKVGNFSNALE